MEQGIICMGPVTQSGCEAGCLSVNMPCRGCYGPANSSEDMGAQMAGVLGSLLAAEKSNEIVASVNEVVDPAGTFYRFGLPASQLGRSKK